MWFFYILGCGVITAVSWIIDKDIFSHNYSTCVKKNASTGCVQPAWSQYQPRSGRYLHVCRFAIQLILVMANIN